MPLFSVKFWGSHYLFSHCFMGIGKRTKAYSVFSIFALFVDIRIPSSAQLLSPFQPALYLSIFLSNPASDKLLFLSFPHLCRLPSTAMWLIYFISIIRETREKSTTVVAIRETSASLKFFSLFRMLLFMLSLD